MTLKEAIQIAEKERNSKVIGANDCGNRWFFSFENDIGKFDGMPIFVYKDDGRCEYFCMAEFMYLLSEGKEICTPIDLEKDVLDKKRF